MKRAIAFLIVVYLFLPGTDCLYAGIFHADEVSTSWYFSNGYEDNGVVYFLVNYCLYQRPVGLGRFPDGGTSKILLNKTYLYRWAADKNRLARLALLDTRERGNSISWSTRLSIAENKLWIGYHGRVFVYDINVGKLTPVPESENDSFYQTRFPKARKNVKTISHKINITRLKKAVSKVPFSAWGLPSPLEYCRKTNKAYADDLVQLRGDQYYRNAIIDKFAEELRIQDIKKILERMDEREKRLKDYEQMEYKIFSVKTRERLEVLLNKNPVSLGKKR